MKPIARNWKSVVTHKYISVMQTRRMMIREKRARRHWIWLMNRSDEASVESQLCHDRTQCVHQDEESNKGRLCHRTFYSCSRSAWCHSSPSMPVIYIKDCHSIIFDWLFTWRKEKCKPEDNLKLRVVFCNVTHFLITDLYLLWNSSQRFFVWQFLNIVSQSSNIQQPSPPCYPIFTDPTFFIPSLWANYHLYRVVF